MLLTWKNLEKRFEDWKSDNLREQNVIFYGCAAHYLNLVENDVSPKLILKQIVKVQQYFRNHHQYSGWLLEKNGVKHNCQIQQDETVKMTAFIVF